MPEPRAHMEHRGLRESILRHIPGFHGYLEKEYRRDSDALQRQWLADRLQAAKHSLDTIGAQLVDAGRLPLLTRYDRLRAQLDLEIARIRGAWQGYSGMFDLVKVDTALLDKIYEHDLASMHAVEEFGNLLTRVVSQANDAPQPAGLMQSSAVGSPTVASASMPAVGATPAVTSTSAVPTGVAPSAPLDAEAALPLLENQLNALALSCDQRSELLKGLG